MSGRKGISDEENALLRSLAAAVEGKAEGAKQRATVVMPGTPYAVPLPLSNVPQ